MYFQGTELAQDRVEAKACFEKACKKGIATSCSALGIMHLRGDALSKTPKDAAAAAPFFKKACHSDHGAACQVLAVMYKKGDGVKKDMGKFEEYKQRALSLLG